MDLRNMFITTLNNYLQGEDIPIWEGHYILVNNTIITLYQQSETLDVSIDGEMLISYSSPNILKCNNDMLANLYNGGISIQ